MKQVNSKWILGLAAIVTITSLALSISASAKHRQAKTEVQALRQQIASMQAALPEPDAERVVRPPRKQKPEPVEKELTSFNSNNAPEMAEAEVIEEEKPERRRESFTERMARMQEEDPEAYAKMIEERAERQERMKYSMAERTANILSLDTSMMNDRELKNHDLLISKLSDIWDLAEQMQDPKAVPDRETRQALGELMRETAPLLQEERSTMFKMLGSQMGYENDEARQFAEEVEAIIDATRLGPYRGRRGR